MSYEIHVMGYITGGAGGAAAPPPPPGIWGTSLQKHENLKIYSST